MQYADCEWHKECVCVCMYFFLSLSLNQINCAELPWVCTEFRIKSLKRKLKLRSCFVDRNCILG